MDDWSWLLLGWIGPYLRFIAWVNMALLALCIGLLLAKNRSDLYAWSVAVPVAAIFHVVQGDGLMFAGGVIASFLGLLSAGLFFVLMLERPISMFNNCTRGLAFAVQVPVALFNLIGLLTGLFWRLALLVFGAY